MRFRRLAAIAVVLLAGVLPLRADDPAPLDLNWLEVKGLGPGASVPAKDAFALGGEAKIVLRPNLALLERVVLQPGEIVDAGARFVRLATKDGSAPEGGEVKLYAADSSSSSRLVGTLPFAKIPAEGEFVVPLSAAEVRAWRSGAPAGLALTLAYEGGNGTPLRIAFPPPRRQTPALRLVLDEPPPARLFPDPAPAPKPGVYVRVQDGHLTYDGKRLRLWGVVGIAPEPGRLVRLGFNAERIWEPSHQAFGQPSPTSGSPLYTAASMREGEFAPYEKGDGSVLDKADKHFADVKAHGFFVMFCALTGTMPFELAMADDSFLARAGGADWEAWKAALRVKGNDPRHYVYVDDRMQALKKRYAKSLLTHVNPYTGKAYGEDEAIAVYEVFNENGFVSAALGGATAKWPAFFRAELQAKWDAWLKARYGDDAALAKAWGVGSLPAGESLASGSVAFSAEGARRGDAARFVVGLADRFHQDFRAYCRSLFPDGVGVNGAPFSFDTYYRPSLPWAYAQSLGDVHAMGMYFWNLQSALDKPPAAYVLDSFTPEAMPTVLYETNSGRPSRYRAEYPLRLAALASFQDWDGVFWHYWGVVPGAAGDHDVAYLNGAMNMPTPKFYWSSVEQENDPSMDAAMALGGRVFLGRLLPPAAKPAVFTLGPEAIFSNADAGAFHPDAATFSRGSRLRFAPEGKGGITLDGAPLPPVQRIAQAIAEGDHVTWDWPRGRLVIDAPLIKAYVGKTDGAFRFSDGIVFGGATVPWIVFAMVSQDGKPLAGDDPSRRVLVGAMGDAHNTGLDMDWNAPALGDPAGQAKAIRDPGHAPVVSEPVGCAVWFPRALKGTFRGYDLALREIRAAAVDGNQIIQEPPTPFLNVLEVGAWGGPAPVPAAGAAQAGAGTVAASAPAPVSALAPADDSAAPFIPGFAWKWSRAEALRNFQGSSLPFSSVGSPDPARIEVAGAQFVPPWNAAADLTLEYEGDRLRALSIAFRDPPPVAEVVARFRALYGEPAAQRTEGQTGTTEARWPGGPGRPAVTVTESQGTLKIAVRPPE